MYKKNRRRVYYFCILFFLVTTSSLYFTSCSSYRKIVYFKDIPDSLHQAPVISGATEYVEPQIHSNDILQITIQSLDPSVSNIMAPSLASATGISSSSSSSSPSGAVSGYLVDKNGFVNLQIVGKIKVSGMTTSEARDMITDKATVFFKDPIVNVRFANFKITVLGEVGHPAQYIVPDEKVSVLDAIAMAGDLTAYARRDNILLIRHVGKEDKYIRFDLNSSEILQSPYFYLKQGDMIYVEPTKSKGVAADAVTQRNVSYAISFVTILLVALTYFRH